MNHIYLSPEYNDLSHALDSSPIRSAYYCVLINYAYMTYCNTSPRKMTDQKSIYGQSFVLRLVPRLLPCRESLEELITCPVTYYAWFYWGERERGLH